MKELGVIVPVYNVEKYIRPCMESIYKQGLDEDCFEVIIINDGSEDRSMEMIKDIIDKHTNIRVVEQKNQGLSVVRNNGIALATGDYIFMPDSDDLLIDGSLPILLDKAIEYQADLVVADYLTMTDDEIVSSPTICQKKFEMEVKTGEKLLVEDLSPYACFVWHTLYRREYLLDTHLKFIPGIYIQDVPFTHECYLRAKKCLRVSWLLNIYRRHDTAATISFNKRKEKDFCTAIAATWQLIYLKEISPIARQKIHDDMYISFSRMISTTVREIEKASDRIEIVDYLREKAPDLYFRNGMKQKLFSFVFSHFPHTYIWIRYVYAKYYEDVLRPFYCHKIKMMFQ